MKLFIVLIHATTVTVSITATARAGTLSDALARHADADVTALRGQRTDVAARCVLGAVYAQRNDLSRAALYLTGCEDAALPADISPQVARIQRDFRRRLDESDLARIEVVTTPDGMTGQIDALPDETFTTPATIYVKAGDYTVHAEASGLRLENKVHAQKRSRGAVLLEAAGAKIAPNKPGNTVDFSDENQLETPATGGPGDVKHKNMMPGKYQKGMTTVAAADPSDAPGEIDDPFGIAEGRRAQRAYWLGLRLGGGLFDDGAAGARAGVAVAATARFALVGSTFLAARVDWSRRGGEGAIDVIGASAGIGHTVIDTRAIGIAVLAQIRGDLRLADSRTTMQMSSPVSRTGAAAAAGVEFALPRTPFSAGLRFEQGLTTLVPGARDRALLLEIGVDWR